MEQAAILKYATLVIRLNLIPCPSCGMREAVLILPALKGRNISCG